MAGRPPPCHASFGPPKQRPAPLPAPQFKAERKRIEAQGIADYQTIINQGLNENLLKWKRIEATRELARGQNTKTVIIGAGKEGLPVILGNQ